MSDDFHIRTGSKKPVIDLRGKTVEFVKPYQGRTSGVVVELIGRNAMGVPMYGCHLDGYVDGQGDPITVDFVASEFKGELGEAYAEQQKTSLQSMQDFIDGE